MFFNRLLLYPPSLSSHSRVITLLLGQFRSQEGLNFEKGTIWSNIEYFLVYSKLGLKIRPLGEN